MAIEFLSIGFISIIVLMMVNLGISNATSGGGTSINTAILTNIIGISLHKAYIVCYFILFGGSTGNLIAQSIKKDYKTNKSPINYKIAASIIPFMLFGSNIGVPFNQILPEAIITLGNMCWLILSFSRVLRKLKVEKAYKMSNEINLEEQKYIELSDKLSNEEFSQQNYFYKKKLTLIILFYALMNFIRGSKSMPSVIGIDTCGLPYWLTFIIMGLFSYKMIPEDTEPVGKKEIIGNSMVAGVTSGTFAIGGGIWVLPILISSGMTIHNATATISFLIFTTSFINFLQAIVIGGFGPFAIIGFLFLSFSASFFISSLLIKVVNRIKRQELILEIMLFMTSLAIIFFPIHFIRKLLFEGKIYDLFRFHNMCE